MSDRERIRQIVIELRTIGARQQLDPDSAFWSAVRDLDDVATFGDFPVQSRPVVMGLATYDGEAQVWDTECIEIPADIPDEQVVAVALDQYRRHLEALDIPIAGCWVYAIPIMEEITE